MIIFLFVATCFLAYANGANDNFKGVATLYGSRTTTFRSAIVWATVTTGAGSIAAIFLAQTLLKKFSGKGLVSDALTVQPEFLLAVGLGAGATVMLATLLGFPISTTHGLTGALVGAGSVSGIANVNFAALGQGYVKPLLLAPILAVVTGAIVYGLLRAVRAWSGVTSESCLCVGAETEAASPGRLVSASTMSTSPAMTVRVDALPNCQRQYIGSFLGLQAANVVDTVHFLSAGAVSFARGLNDTPKIAALLLVATALNIQGAMIAVAVAMALGGLLNARKVADTMANKLTSMNAGQGLSANLATAFLVGSASLHGMPVSTTHVSVGALLGIGVVTRQVKWTPVRGVLASWVITLPCAAAMAALAYTLLKTG